MSNSFTFDSASVQDAPVRATAPEKGLGAVVRALLTSLVKEQAPSAAEQSAPTYRYPPI